jgi:hypothetical protein
MTFFSKFKSKTFLKLPTVKMAFVQNIFPNMTSLSTPLTTSSIPINGMQNVSYPVSNFNTGIHSHQLTGMYPVQVSDAVYLPVAVETNHGGPNGKGFQITGQIGEDRTVSEADCKILGIPFGSMYGDAPVEDYYPYGDPGAYGTPVPQQTIDFMDSDAYNGEVKLPLNVLQGLLWGTGAVPVPWGQRQQ